MPSELDPQLEAVTRLAISDLSLLHEVATRATRKYLLEWSRRRERAERSAEDVDELRAIYHDLDEEMLKALSDEARSLLSRSLHDRESDYILHELECQKIDNFERLLARLRRVTSKILDRRFRPFARLLTAQATRLEVTQRIAFCLLSMTDDLSEEFAVPNQTSSIFGNSFVTGRIQRIADEVALVPEADLTPDLVDIDRRAAEAGVVGTTANQETLDDRGEHERQRLEAGGPADVPPVAADNVRGKTQPASTAERTPKPLEFSKQGRRSSSARQPDPRKLLIAKFKTQGVTAAEEIAVLLDKAIEKMDHSRCAPLREWADRVPGLRTWKEFLDHELMHKRVRNYINKVPPMPSEISQRAS